MPDGVNYDRATALGQRPGATKDGNKKQESETRN
jgi:hypothetical protein